jgi:integrase
MRGDGKVFKRPGVSTWSVGIYLPGTDGKKHYTIRSSGSTSRKAGEDLLKHLRSERDKVRFSGVRPIVNAHRVTVGRLLDLLELDYKTRRIKSLDSALYHLRPVREYFGARKALSVTPSAAQEYVAHRRGEKKADATSDNELSLLRAAFKAGEAEGLIGASPKIPGLHARNRNKRRVFLTLQETADVLAAMGRRGQAGLDYYRALFLTGLRPITIQGLLVSDVDVERWTLAIRQEEDKNNYGRELPLVGELRALIEERLARRLPGCDLLFHRDGAPLLDEWVRDFFYGACEDAGIVAGRKNGGKTPYDLKKTALRVLRSVMPEQVAMLFSGHKTEGTFRDYAITDDAEMRQGATDRDEYLRQNLPAEAPVRRVASISQSAK